VAINAYRAGKLPFPEGAIVGRIAWSYIPSEENNKVFCRTICPESNKTAAAENDGYARIMAAIDWLARPRLVPPRASGTHPCVRAQKGRRGTPADAGNVP
jgi:hypothetical protein